MSKREDTKLVILMQALDMVSQIGFEGLTIGTLAKQVGMSKSGLYAHFKSKDDLQKQVLDTAADRFADEVLRKAFKKPRGIPRLEALFKIWLDWAMNRHSGGCPFIGAATEFDDRPGPVRDHLVKHQKNILETIAQCAQMGIAEGQFIKRLDLEQFAFEFWGILLSYHHYTRLIQNKKARRMADKTFNNLILNSSDKR